MKALGLSAILMPLMAITSIGAIPLNAEEEYEVKKTSFHYIPMDRGDLPYYTADLYYSQGYFAHPSTQYDPHLATASLSMAMSSIVGIGKIDEEWYYNQSQHIEYFFNQLEFNTFKVNEDYRQSATLYTIGLAVAKKEYEDYTVVAVVPRSGGYYREWASNMHLGDGSKSDYMHEGWYNAANKLINFVTSYVEENQVKGRVKLWMAGFSRGGATTNIAAGLLDNRLDKGEKIFYDGAYTSREDIYAYTFEAPQGANVNSKTVKKPNDPLYDNIFNIINPLDIVPKVAMKEYGFTRFGINKYITNKFYQPDEYEKNRNTFSKLHDIFNQNKKVVVHPDDFKVVGFSLGDIGLKLINLIIDSISGGDISDDLDVFRDNTKKNYDANIAGTILIEEFTSNMGDRNSYVKKYQDPLIGLMLVIQYEKDIVPNTLLTFGKIFLTSAIINAVLNSPALVRLALKNVWGDSYAENIYTFIGRLKSPLFDTYWERPNELISVAANITNIFENHYPDITLAHVAGQDSYFLDDYNKDKLGDDKLKLVPFMDNADFGRMKFFGYNDIGLRLESKKGTRVINIEGHLVGKSDILQCDDGYAAGYYSYATEEKMEAFMPINRKYNISMKSYSKKPYHRCEYWAYYQYFALTDTNSSRKQLDHKKEKTCFNSDRHKRDVTIKL